MFAARMVEDVIMVSQMEHRMTFVDGSRWTHDLLSGRASMSRELTTFLRGRVYYGPPTDEGAGTSDASGVRFDWIVCAVDGVL
jgi:hypothetical protein